MQSALQLVDAESGRVIVPRLRLAVTFWRRFCGLQFQRPLPPEEGLLIRPCRSIHTHWMRFAIDVAMLSGDGEVLAIRQHLSPWRMYGGPREAAAVLETTAGVLQELEKGQRLLVAGAFASPIPLSDLRG